MDFSSDVTLFHEESTDKPVVKPLGGEEKPRRFASAREVARMLLPILFMVAALVVDQVMPNIYPEGYESFYLPLFYVVSIIIYVAFIVGSIFLRPLRKRVVHVTGLLCALYALIMLFDIATVKTGWLMLPFIPCPDRILSVVPSNFSDILVHFEASMLLYVQGLVIGLVTGFISGVLLGWSHFCDYWFSPVLRVVGPVPSVAWLPIAVVLFPSSHWAGVFLIALAMWFPLTFLLSSALKSTDRRKIEAARVLGAGEGYVLFRVALPAALPDMFTGLFMGLATSFSSLIVAEQLGVKAGLGWYIQWGASWGEYATVYAGVGIFIILFYVLIMILFKVRNRAMRWQKNLIRW